MNKMYQYFTNLNFLDFIRKLLFFFLGKFNLNICGKIKAIFFFKTNSINLGKRVKINGLAFDIKVGNKTSIYDSCIFEFSNKASVRIGSNVVFSYGVIFCCKQKIIIGNDVQIGEYTSIRDTTHQYEQKGIPMKYNEDLSAPILIENDVWIGRGCIIMPGTIIESGVVVAANSVVKGHLQRDCIYGGSPVKFIKKR